MRQSIFVFSINLLFFLGTAYAEPDMPNQTKEIQILIDVSGSMKQNDPKNLRKDATQLLISLLPDQTKVSLWLFAEKTTLLSHSDAIDEQWRKQALKNSRAIHSRGLYTDIENAISTVLESGFHSKGDHHLILLTDGMVDISKDIMVSADSRERIFSEWIPRLRQQRITVQTVALSNQADKELLEKLAFDTDGWSELAQSAEQLQRLFSKMAQKAAPKDTVPVEDNQFSIDESIQEFSVLVFKKPDAPATALIKPNQEKITKSKAPNNITWLETSGYDLVTVKQPMAGDWQIIAEMDPDNRVMVLTDLKLQMEESGNFIDEKSDLPLKLYFTEKDQLIERRDFLDLVTLTLSTDQQDAVAIPALNDQPGFFATILKELGKGKHSLRMVADGKTFKREIVRELEVVASPIRIEQQVDAANRQVTLKFVPDSAALDSSTLAIAANLYQNDEATDTRAVAEQNGEWALKLDRLPPGAELSVHFNVMAKTPDGKAISPTLAPITIDDSWFTTNEQSGSQEQSEPAPANPKAEAADNTEPADQDQTSESKTEPEPKTNWGLSVGLVGLANLLLCVIGFFVYKALKKAAAKKQKQLLERLS